MSRWLSRVNRKRSSLPLWGYYIQIPFLEFASGDPWIVFLSPLLMATVMTIAAARFGMLALYTFFFFHALSSANGDLRGMVVLTSSR